jgi:Predicted ATPase involved in replication control, Cdc46/Mcm family
MVEATIDEQLALLFKQQKYRIRLQQLWLNSNKCLCVDFLDLILLDIGIANSLLDKPTEYLHYLAMAAYTQLCIEDPVFSAKVNEKQIQVKIGRLESSESLRTLGAEQLGKLVMVEGVVISATPIKPAVEVAAFICQKCGSLNLIQQSGQFMQSPGICMAPDCGGNGPFTFDSEQSVFVDSQEIYLQERPEELPAGQLPRKIAVKLQGKELVECTRPGDRVSVIGVPSAIPQTLPGVGKLRTFNLSFDANSVEQLEKESASLQPTPQEEEEIKQLAKDPNIHRKITESIAPSIYGYEEVKKGLALIQFGGVAKHLDDINIRGELNVLLIGDPGIAKTQLLLYMAKVAPRGYYASGKGATAVGLTAAVTQDKKTGGYVLQAGALVLADKGLAAIDEIDKMKEEDRVGLHEAMEQHRVSINKGGINATLNARTAVLAACNPSLGRYDPFKTVTDNINLPVTLLSRFDLIFVLRDIPDKNDDAKKAKHVLNLHRRKVKNESLIKPELLRKYIAYSKTIEPTLTDDAVEKLEQYYAIMRGASNDGAIAITIRQLEALTRMAEAHARIRLSPTVSADDADVAIKLMKYSLDQLGIDADIDVIMTGKSKNTREQLSDIIEAVKNQSGPIPRKDLIALETRELKLSNSEVEKLIAQLMREGTLYEPKEGMVWRGN